jgi:Putative addiction module component
MSTSLEVLQAEVARLAPADRARLLEHLIASLDVDAEVEAAWDAVADAREADAVSGKRPTIAFEDAITRLEARFPG